MKIDTSTWRGFRVGDYFHGIRGASRKMQELDEGLTPVIAAARYNQGIAGYYNVPAEYENAITISCNGAGCGSTYYHDYPFAITGDAIVLKNIGNVPISAMHFIASVYDTYFTRKYSYTDKCSADKAESEIIKLPATPSGEPDWDYMESYMKNVMGGQERQLEFLLRSSSEPKNIDVSGWGEFRLKDIGFANYHGTRLTKADRKEGTIPLITAGKENQGVAQYISNAPSVYKDAITVDMFGNAFFHKGYYTGDDNVYFFVNENISDASKIFIAAILNADNSKIYAYKEQFRQPQADKLSVYLPITSTGEPDWKYMEIYMKKIMNSSEQTIKSLQTIIV